MANGKIAQITDLGDEILLSAVADTFLSITNAGGTAWQLGSDPGDAGSLEFAAGLGFNAGASTTADTSVRFAGYATSQEFLDLDGEGQIVWKATPNGLSQFDNNVKISGSMGDDRTGTGFLLINRQSGGGPAESTISQTGGEIVQTKYVAGDVAVSDEVHSFPDNSHIEMCFSWSGGSWVLYVDGAPYQSSAHGSIIGTEIWFQTIFGSNISSANYWGAGDLTHYLKDLIVSSDPVLALSDFGKVGIFGDSFCTFFTRPTDDEALNLTGVYQIPALFFNNLQQTVTVDDQGHGGFSMCDTASGMGNLVNQFAGFVATNPKIAVIMAGNNDCTDGTDLEVSNGTTGTQARYEEIITDLFNAGITERIIVVTPGSMAAQEGGSDINTPANNARRVTVDGIVKGLAAFGDTLQSGFVQVVDLFTLFGGDTIGVEYIGGLNVIGNVTTPGVALPNERHPSGQGSYMLSTAFFDAIFATAEGAAPTLTTTYDNQVFTLNAAVNLSVSSNWSLIDPNSFTSPDLPIGLSISATGTITGNMRIGGIIDCNIHVVGITGQKMSAGFIWYERL